MARDPKKSKQAHPALGWLKTLQAANDVFTTCTEYLKEADKQKTERARIAAETREHLAKVAAIREVLMDFLRRTFDERAALFKELFERLDAATEGGDVQTAALTLTAITELAKSSPFKSLKDAASFQRAIADKGTDWKF